MDVNPVQLSGAQQWENIAATEWQRQTQNSDYQMQIATIPMTVAGPDGKLQNAVLTVNPYFYRPRNSSSSRKFTAATFLCIAVPALIAGIVLLAGATPDDYSGMTTAGIVLTSTSLPLLLLAGCVLHSEMRRAATIKRLDEEQKNPTGGQFTGSTINSETNSLRTYFPGMPEYLSTFVHLYVNPSSATKQFSTSGVTSAPFFNQAMTNRMNGDQSMINEYDNDHYSTIPADVPVNGVGMHDSTMHM